MNMKKILALVLALAMVFSMRPRNSVKVGVVYSKEMAVCCT